MAQARPPPARPAGLPRPRRWAWIISTVAALGAGVVLAFLLSIATNSPALYERHYVWLFWVNVGLASLLVTVIVVAAVRLLWRVSRGRFGSRLLLKLAAIFALVGVLPGVLIYTVSYQFVSRSIESWFDVKVEGALDAGLNTRPRHDRHDRHRPRDQDPARRRAARRERHLGRAALARAAARAALGARRSGSSAAPARACSRPARRARG